MSVAGSGTKVVKGSGETEVFDPNIITTDCVEAGVEFWTAAEVALEVSKDVFDGINSDEIQRKILGALYNRNPEVAERYKRFHSMYVRTSSNTIERFDRKRIVDSLIKETSLPKEVAGVVAKETEVELRRLNLDFTSGPLIREIVNVKLLEHGYEGARSDYTRLGMPVYDAAQFIESPRNGHSGSSETLHREMTNSIFREYSLLKVLPLHLADAHMKGEIHVHDLEYFVTRLFTAVHDLRFFLRNGLQIGGSTAGPAKNPTTAVLHAVKALAAFSSVFSSVQGFHSFNIWLAPFIEGLDEAGIYQLAQTILFEISQTSNIGLHSAFGADLEIELEIPASIADIPAVLPGGVVKSGICYQDFEGEARGLARALAEVYSKGDCNGLPFHSPQPIFKIRRAIDDSGDLRDVYQLVHEVGSRLGKVNILNLFTSPLPSNTTALSTGVVFQTERDGAAVESEDILNHFGLQCTTLNLPRIAYKSGGRDETFFETLDQVMDMAREVASVKMDVMTRRMRQGALAFSPSNGDESVYFKLENASNFIGYVGLNEACKAHVGEELHEGTYPRDFGVRVIRFISERLRKWADEQETSWLLTAMETPAIANRFALLDSGQFSEAVQSIGEAGRYTGSCHISRSAGLSLESRVPIERLFTGLNNGGQMVNINVGGKSSDELLKTSDEMIKSRFGYWGFAP